MELSKCDTHSRTAPVSTFDEAMSNIIGMRQTFAQCRILPHLGQHIAQYDAERLQPHCCAASWYARHLIMAAWREYLRTDA